MSALGAANSSLFSAARYCMTGARYGYLPEIFACIQKTRLTPITGIILEVRILLLVLYSVFFSFVGLTRYFIMPAE